MDMKHKNPQVLYDYELKFTNNYMAIICFNDIRIVTVREVISGQY